MCTGVQASKLSVPGDVTFVVLTKPHFSAEMVPEGQSYEIS